MTDNEIIKTCKDCLHYGACKGTYSSAKGDEDILYDFDGEMYAQSGCEDFEYKDLINRQKAELERLQNILLAFMGALGKIQKVEDIESISLIPIMWELNEQLRTDIEAEAVKEFAERFEAYIPNIEGETTMECVKNAIKQTLKETVGENND